MSSSSSGAGGSTSSSAPVDARLLRIRAFFETCVSACVTYAQEDKECLSLNWALHVLGMPPLLGPRRKTHEDNCGVFTKAKTACKKLYLFCHPDRLKTRTRGLNSTALILEAEDAYRASAAFDCMMRAQRILEHLFEKDTRHRKEVRSDSLLRRMELNTYPDQPLPPWKDSMKEWLPNKIRQLSTRLANRLSTEPEADRQRLAKLEAYLASLPATSSSSGAPSGASNGASRGATRGAPTGASGGSPRGSRRGRGRGGGSRRLRS